MFAALLLTAAALIGSSVWTSVAAAQVTHVGGEFQINSYTPGNQIFAAVGADADGAFVVAWTSVSQDGSSNGIFAQRYDSAGSRAGSEFQVNTYTPLSQAQPHVAADAAGDFTIVWVSPQDGSSFGIFGQRYSSGGTPTGTEFQVNTYTAGLQYRPSATAAPDGTFVVVWQSDRDGTNPGIFGQRFDSSGVAAGTEFQVNTYTQNQQKYPNVSTDADGNFVVVWQSANQDGDGTGVFGQRFDNGGSRVGTEFQVDTYTVGFQSDPQIAADADGDFTIVWDDQTYPSYRDGSGLAVVGRRFTSAGSASGPPFVVNTFTDSNQLLPAVAADAGGNFVVSWNSFAQDGDFYGVFARRYASTGNPLSTEFQVNSFTPSIQANYWSQPIAETPQGFVIVWWSVNQDGSVLGAFGQRFALASPATETPTATPTPTDSDTPTATPTLQAGCPPAPDGGCHGAAKNFLLVKDKSNDAADQVKWKWNKAVPMLAQGDFGNPVNGSTGYRVCIYDETSDTPSLKFGAEVAAGGTCSSFPCWKTLSDKGYKYSNPDTNAEGLKKIILKGGEAGKPKLIVIGKGDNLAMPGAFDATNYFDQDSEVVIQLGRTDSTACWQSTFGTATTIDNTARQFKAK